VSIGTAYGQWSPDGQDEPPPAILACGPENSLKQEMIDELQSTFPSSDREIISIYAHESSPEDVVRELSSQGLFNDSRWILLKQLANKETGQAQLSRYYDAIEEYLDDPEPNSLLVMFDDAHPYKGGRRTGGMARTVQDAGGEVIVFWEPFEKEMVQRIRTAFEKNDVEWETGVIERIIEKSQGKVGRMDNEVEKLIDFLGGEQRLTVEDVERVVSSEEAQDAYDDIKQALNDGSPARLVEALEEFYRQASSGEEVAVAHVILNYIQDLREIRRDVRGDSSLEEALSERGIPTSEGVKKQHRRGIKALAESFPRNFFREGYQLLRSVKYRNTPMNRRSLEQFVCENVPEITRSA
jgi:DNA polymerase III delta subunit